MQFTRAEIDRARHVLFAVFARYGDSIIAFKTINEFIAAHPDKTYVLITTPQALPYARTLVRAPVELYGVNKRRNPLRMARLVALLKRNPPDIAFNPWSHGEDSEYFASFAQRFFLYRSFADFTREVNLYRRVRDYLMLPMPKQRPRRWRLERAAHIVIAPFSTDIRKSLNAADMARLLEKVRARYTPQTITIAAFAEELKRIDDAEVEHFLFSKSDASSETFLALLRKADLFIGVDAGPLHVAAALAIPSIGLFGPTAPETILDYDSKVLPLRTATLEGVFCDVLDCPDPVCVHQMSADFTLDR
ncbi:MAG TPA: glycosyltransferase family 9 protein, partial [Burkholderiaceae bacterium]|nr:glycosyltransferase family 9 protein [Burkholderiaceae bacterium]